MGFFTSEKEDALMKCTIQQLKQMAEEKKITVRPLLFQSTPNKDAYVSELSSSDKITLKYINQILNGEGKVKTSSAAPKTGKKMSAKAVAKAINDDFLIHKRLNSEAEYERDFINWARGRFGSANVVSQFAVGRTKIDAVISGVGVEIKCPKNQRPLMTLRGQVEVYQKHFGEDLIVLLFSADCDTFAVDDFIRDMKKKNVIVVDKK